MTPSRILVVHNRYREPGGEDQVFAAETALLREHGHSVVEYVDSNDRLDERRPLAAAVNAVWSRETCRRLQLLIAETRPELAHFHNTASMISPAAYYACQRAGVPVVQTLHNFRLGCLNGGCSRLAQPCEQCLDLPFAAPGVWRACYRDSRAASALAATREALHRLIGTYHSQVDAFISTSQFARRRHLCSGIPARLSHLKPNFALPAAPAPAEPGGYVLYAGRLSRDKGAALLCQAWRGLSLAPRLLLAGDGPDAASLRAAHAGHAGIEFLGPLEHSRVLALLAHADFFVQPSLLEENCSLALIEAMSAARAVVVSGHGSFVEMVEDEVEGLHFRPGDEAALRQQLARLIAHPDLAARLGRRARLRFERCYSPEPNYAQLMAIYAAARRQHELGHS